MKTLKTIWILLAIATLFSCKKKNPLTGDELFLSAALEEEYISFSIDGELIESDDVSNLSTRFDNCSDWGNWEDNCEAGAGVYQQSFSIWLNRDTPDRFRFEFTPWILVDSSLVEVACCQLPWAIFRPYKFHNPENIQDLFLNENDWTSNLEERKTHFSLSIGYGDFFGDKFLDSNDQFLITEIEEIYDKSHSFLISGIFNAIMIESYPDFGMDPDTIHITEGKFSVIVDPF